MSWIRGYYRLCLAGLILGFGGYFIILTAWIPIKIKGVRLSMRWTSLIARILLMSLNVRLHCREPEKLRQHQGFIFPNHVSHLDVPVLFAIAPIRFLAKAEVRVWPVIGQLGQAIGSVFVKREDKESRAEARLMLAQVERFPPIVIFPEGKRGPGEALLPFRHGAFEIVAQGSAPFLPCAIVYDQLETAIWRRGEHIWKSLWRLATYKGPLRAEVIPMAVVYPSPSDDPVQLAVETHAALAAVLRQAEGGERGGR